VPTQGTGAALRCLLYLLGPTRCYSIAPAQRIQGYIWGYICGGESERGPPCRRAVYICGYVGLIAWRRERRREGEGEGEGVGGGERSETTLRQIHWTSKIRQNHSTSTAVKTTRQAQRSKPFDKHSTPIDRQYNDRSVDPKSLSE
jgi:hypothetical protein